MTKQIAPLTQRQAWKALEAHYTSIREFHLRKLFADDPKRGERMTAEALGLYLDYSKNRITDETLKLLLQLAEESGLRERIDAIATVRRIRILAEGLTPETLAKLVALYEHSSASPKVVIWNIDSFGPVGCGAGKVLAQRIIPELESKEEPTLNHDSSTNNLIRRYRKLKRQKTE